MRYQTKNKIRGLAVACLFAAAVAVAQEKIRFDIPEQDASTAIQSWARQSGLQIFAAQEHLRGVRAHAVRGEYSPLEAMQLLIAGTGLEVVSTGEKTVTLRRPNDAPAAAEPPATRAAAELDEVVITGSRIKRAGFDTLEAALVTGSGEIERRGYTNIGQALEATPGPNVGFLSSQFGQLVNEFHVPAAYPLGRSGSTKIQSPSTKESSSLKRCE